MTFGPRGSCNRQVFFWKLGASITVERTAKSSNRMDVVTLVPSNAISSGAIAAIAEGTFPQFRQLAHNSGRCCQQCQSLGVLFRFEKVSRKNQRPQETLSIKQVVYGCLVFVGLHSLSVPRSVRAEVRVLK